MIQDWKNFHKSMLYLFKLAEAKQVQIDLFNYLLDDYFYKLGQADHDTFEQDFDLFDALSSDILLIANNLKNKQVNTQGHIIDIPSFCTNFLNSMHKKMKDSEL